ncbi:copper homeostasis protein CutC [Sediminispirochaeta bajacaliforniensis]|uniref:copper homeostasis protein CutC n=1 Tax=Sediminispirochaeta bajacaliforniensis TaxID=148 RepID=UPI000361B0AC|nr:copper homeostasis protein CutC [Sediminispirochaeta bajacaliforniensis]
MDTQQILQEISIEVCLDSVESSINAQQGGADRVELCDNLFQGGTTPSIGTIRAARKAIDIGLQVIIRPRGGDFFYSDYEFEVMKEDILAAREAGADGVVFGILTPDGLVDSERNALLRELAGPMNATFHRAFDVTRNPFDALETIIDLGFNRILTSGQAPTVLEGVDLVRELVDRAQERIIIMPGNGITPRNMQKIIELTGAREYHVFVDRERESGMTYRPGDVYMGGLLRQPEFVNSFTDRDMVTRLRSLGSK